MRKRKNEGKLSFEFYCLAHWIVVGSLILGWIPLGLSTTARTTGLTKIYQWILTSIQIFILILLPFLVIGLVVGLIYPKWVRAKTRKQVLIILGVSTTFASFAFGILGLFSIDDPSTKPLFLIGTSLFLYIGSIIFGYFYLKQFNNKKLLAAISIWSLGIIAAVPLVLGSLLIPHLEHEIIDSASQVCNGEIIENAAEYINAGPHPVVVGNLGYRNYEYTNSLPDAWLPENIDELELVACPDEEHEVLIESCQYEMGSTLRRYQYKREIKLIEAKTGKIIVEDTLEGSVPPLCPSSMVSGDKQKYGSHSLVSLKNWLNKFVASHR
jgi:hypothetical protein